MSTFTDLTDINARFEPAIDAESEANQRRQVLAGQVAAVRRRSRRIRTLRRVFPGLIIGLGLLNVGWIVVTSVIGSFNVYNVSGTEIRMTNPRYSGLNSQGSPWIISGLEAIKKAGDTTIATLKAPVIEFKGDGDKASHISAANGIYDADAKTFRLIGNVVMVSGNSDMTFRTEEAVMNMQDMSISGDKHIEGTGSMGHIVGESFVISKNGSDIIVRGRGEAQAHGVVNGKAGNKGRS
ncbi:LPS export ABC transporter periplasmic protein LptC [Asticcacaulis solisilvae]|uniref:LPS export ABC transporter periplasmic protein LptC n=1 Tax=Asticcacaulis solisilvae TaxID=1217274 RepID=UPI003FD8C06A